MRVRGESQGSSVVDVPLSSYFFLAIELWVCAVDNVLDFVLLRCREGKCGLLRGKMHHGWCSVEYGNVFFTWVCWGVGRRRGPMGGYMVYESIWDQDLPATMSS